MKKYIYVEILNDYMELESSADTSSNKNIYNVIMRTYSKRRKKSVKDLIKEHYNIKKCRNCNSDAEYEIDYEIKRESDDEIYFSFKDIRYPKYKDYEKLYCGKCLKKYNANSKKYVSKIYGITEEEANKIILERNNSPFYSNNHDSKEDYKRWQKRDKGFYISKYGIKEGEKKFNENIKKWQEASNSDENRYKKDSTSYNFFLKKFDGDKEKAKIEYIRRRKDLSYKSSLQYLIDAYGKEKGEELYLERLKKLSYNNTLKCYKEKYGEKEGIKKYNNWKNKITLDINSFIKKYGTDEGKKRYKKWLIGITRDFNHYSKESIDFFNKLSEFFKKYNILYGKNEWFIYEEDKQKIYFYDAYIKELNLLIEYDTPAFHPNPNYLTESEIEKYNFKGDYNKDLYKKKIS